MPAADKCFSLTFAFLSLLLFCSCCFSIHFPFSFPIRWSRGGLKVFELASAASNWLCYGCIQVVEGESDIVGDGPA